MKGKTYPGALFLVRGKDGKGHFFTGDPAKPENRGSSEVDVAEELFRFYGDADIAAPLKLRVAGLISERGDRFDIAAPGRIRSGETAKHFEDIEGNIVEVLEMSSPDSRFPVNGVVVDRKGKLIAQRLYDGEGVCNDGDECHRLIVVDGRVANLGVNASDKEGEGAEEEI